MEIFSRVCPVLVLLTSTVKMRQILVQAQRRGMCNGDYAFFAVDVLKTDILKGIGEGAYGWENNDIYDQEASTAYRALFVLTLRQSTLEASFQAFAKEVRKRVKSTARAPPLEVNYKYSPYHAFTSFHHTTGPIDRT